MEAVRNTLTRSMEILASDAEDMDAYKAVLVELTDAMEQPDIDEVTKMLLELVVASVQYKVDGDDDAAMVSLMLTDSILGGLVKGSDVGNIRD